MHSTIHDVPDELRAVTIGPDQSGTTSSLAGFLASVLGLTEGTLKQPEKSNGVKQD